jgi:hypothetical protein
MRAEITTKSIVYRIPAMDSVTVQRGRVYRDALTLDLYYPPDHSPDSAHKPAVVIVLGYPDVGVPLVFGCQFREMEMYIGWAKLLAACGMVGILYETSHPATDALAVLAHVRENAAALGIDANRIGVWAGSGNVPVALSVLMQGNVRCGALCYGFMLDLDGATGVAQAAAQFHFANPVAGRSVEDLPQETALFLARAGQDQFAGLNPSLDAFAAVALRRNPHAFDIMDDSNASRAVIRAIVEFMKSSLEA